MADVILRPVIDADAMTLFRWRNDETTRKFSGRRGRITWQDHAKWFCDRYDSKRVLWWTGRWYIALADESLQPVGVVRIDTDDRNWVSITVAPEARGKGYGYAILARLAERLGTPRPLFARIHRENAASLKLFERAGYQFVESDGVWQTWERTKP